VKEPHRKAIEEVISQGYQISPQAYKFLLSQPSGDVERLVSLALDRARRLGGVFVLEPHHFTPEFEVVEAKAPVDSQMVILPQPEAVSIGSAQGYLRLFQSRFQQLESIMKSRMDLRDAAPLAQVLKLPLKVRFKTIAMVADKYTRGRRLFLELESPEASATAMVSDQELVSKALEVLKDQVICLEGIRYNQGLLIANDLIWPDVPLHQASRSEKDSLVVFTGDLHIGSNYFRRDLFQKLLDWLNQRLGPRPSRELASKVKYLVLVGDTVDGIGVYPEQLGELTISTQLGQYEEAAQLLEGLPKHIETLIIPGNHDAVRRSLPQPPIDEPYAPSLYGNPPLPPAPNPPHLHKKGVKVLVAHGTALTDILGSTPGHDFHNPITAMELLLRCRHLAPTYGLNTPLAPESTDRLVISQVPDVMVMGHIHIYGSKRYRGVTLVSTGCFQDQTPFQRRMDLKPTPGIVSLFNLRTHEELPLDLESLG